MRAFVPAAAIALATLFAACGDDTAGGSSAGTGTPGAGGSSGGSGPTTGGTGPGSGGEGGAAASGAAGGSGGGTAGAGGAAADTWESYAKGFFVTYCIECHGAGDALRDYTTYADVMAESAEIRCGVAATQASGCSGFPPPKQFPIDNASGNNAKPADDERDRLVAWIEAGLPQ